MSGKFVAGGTLDKLTDRDDAWLQAEQDLEDRRKERERNKAAHDGKTLFEVLQANKAAKEETFQESIKLKNQFRALNDDEVDFLDSQVDAKIAKERAIQQENSEQLRLFRQRQDATYADIIDAIADEKDPQKPAAIEMDTNWTTSKKRKRDKEKEVIKGVKIRRNPSNIIREDDPVMSSARHSSSHGKSRLTPASPASKLENSSQNSVPATKREGPRLVTYDSDDEDD